MVANANMLSQLANRYWYNQSPHVINYLFLPLSWLFGLCVAIRRKLYQLGILSAQRLPVPVIVVGNITVGGTGKTPFVIWLANFLREQGYHPGIVSRGVGGKKQTQPRAIKMNDAVAEVGDEAILLAKKSACPVVIGIDRAKAARYLLQHANCNVIISDDGLQHYRLARDIEIALLDGERQLGNKLLLPAGPLREPASRLNSVDMVLMKGSNEAAGLQVATFAIEPTQLISITKSTLLKPLSSFAQQKVHAVAGIGNPDQFFASLQQAGLNVIPHVFPDHYLFQAEDLNFNDDLPIIMTEKDAVKCVALNSERCWYVDITVKTDDALQQSLLTLLSNVNKSLKGVSNEESNQCSCDVSNDY